MLVPIHELGNPNLLFLHNFHRYPHHTNRKKSKTFHHKMSAESESCVQLLLPLTILSLTALKTPILWVVMLKIQLKLKPFRKTLVEFSLGVIAVAH